MALTKVTYSMIEGIGINVIDYGAVGDGVADDTVAIQAACDAGTVIYFGDSTKSYKIDGTITVGTGTTLYGDYPTITQTANNTPLFDASNTDGLTVYGLSMVGVGTDFIDSDITNPAIAVKAHTATNVRVFNNNFTNFSYTTLSANDSSDILFTGNTAIGPGTPILTPITDGRCYGVLINEDCNRVLIDNNTISKCAQGVRIELAANVVVSNNIIFDIVGQHGVYSGAGVVNQNISNNIIYDCELIGIKCQAEVVSAVDVNNVVISGNNVADVGDQGILLCCGDGTRKAIRVIHVSVTGNVIKGTGATGLNIQNVTNGTVSSNSVFDCGDAGINLSACDYVVVDGNTIVGTVNSGLRDQTGNTNLVISDNRIHAAASGVTAGNKYGIYFADSTGVSIDGNVISDGSAKMQYGIYIAANQESVGITNNISTNATDYAVRFENNTDPLLAYSNNVFAGTLGVGQNSPALPSVASAATISVPTNVSFIKVTGTTGISAINATGQTGQVVTLFFEGVLTVTDGAGLLLNSNFVTTANDTLTLACDGNVWYEVARSVN
jgi:parallel beta-helix repeat protein